MAVITPFRDQLFPPKHALQPSAMPAPTPSVSPFLLPQKFDKRPTLLGQHDKDKENVHAIQRTQSNTHTALSVRQTNAEASTSRLPPKTKSLSFQTAIPHLPAVPDVFTPAASHSDQYETSSKRAGTDLPSSVPAKKRREALGDGDNSLNSTAAKRQESQQDVWRQKWIKSFPTLIFHFELGAEEGSGKGLKSRAIKMGARVDQFFSTKITHLVVKTLSSPKKVAAKRETPRESSGNPFLDNTGVTDLAQKAQALGIKVWTVKKLYDILERLSPNNVGPVNSLSTLLEEEKIHGTRERDVTAPRPDFYYFRPQHKYILVEDATGKHRTVLVKEYPPLKDKAEWPTLHGSFLPISSYNITNIPVNQLRERAIALYVDKQPWKGEKPVQGLSRSTSLRAIKEPELPESVPYQNASGNSVVLTSNIASTSNANQSPAFLNGMPQLGANKGSAVMQMSKRVQVLKGNAAKAAPAQRRASTGAAMEPPAAKDARPFMTQEQVIRMLQRVKGPVDYNAEITVEKRIENRRCVEALKGKEQDTAGGYCENCRVKFPDLSLHMSSRKHRRFAENSDNFLELDTLLAMLRRPPNPATVDYDAPGVACWENHDFSVGCELCIPLDNVVCEESVGDSESDESI